MATYGKKKRSILPSFSVLRDSDTGSKSKEKEKKRGSMAFSTPVFQDSNFKKESLSHHNAGSIEDMASMLLEDTTFDQLRPESGKRMSYSATAALPGLPRIGSQDDRSLPQLPTMLFNGDDAWAMRMTSVVTTAASLNEIDLSHEFNELSCINGQTGQTSIPAIPRKSSKRKSSRPKSTFFQPHTEAGDRRRLGSRQTLKSPPRLVGSSAPRQPAFAASDINNKIEAMMAATQALKPGSDGTHIQEALASTKKRRLMDNKVLSKVRTAFNDRFPARNGRKRGSMMHARLLDSGSLHEAPDFEDENSPSAATLTTMELRMNEGRSPFTCDNFKNPKIFTLTGHGNIRRKPLADDGKSLRSRRSTDHPEDPFVERPSSGLTRTPTSFGNLLNDSSSGSDFVPDLPSRCQTPARISTQGKRFRTSLYAGDFDAMLSSSPFAQSTPRIRLEPTFEEDGRSTLNFVPADTRSLFDPDNSSMDLDTDVSSRRPSSQEPVKRKSSGAQEFGVRNHASKRVKKHPSPSKVELEGLEKDLRGFLPGSLLEDFALEDDKFSTGRNLAPPAALSARDPNRKLRGTRRHALKLESLATAESMPNFPTRSRNFQAEPSSIRKKAVEGLSRQFMSHGNITNNSMMDIDELQWNNPSYIIGMMRR
ncbi:unnamed protein product [Diplocarpon coronariae]|uniref:Uncharacterized protein n=1 Tax=Diplocarpon coronariae TaxID=2795749 RepID=A0A218YS40_9HELO|nr:hypothetical protein B2J93_6790 [Marssonina coronariae]